MRLAMLIGLSYGSTLAAVLSLVNFAVPLAAPPDPPKDVIRFPALVPEVGPIPKPDPLAVPTLTSDTLYIIDADAAFLVFASPEGIVTLNKETGPLRIRGKFIDGSGRTETRTFKGTQIVSVEAIASGRVEIIVIPVGATDEKSATRKIINANVGPVPPPVIPIVVPKVPEDLASALLSAWTLEPAAEKRVQVAKLQSAFLSASVKANDLSITTRRQLAANAHALGNVAVTDAGLLLVRRAAGDWLNKTVGQTDVPLDPALRKAYSEAYQAVAAGLATLK